MKAKAPSPQKKTIIHKILLTLLTKFIDILSKKPLLYNADLKIWSNLLKNMIATQFYKKAGPLKITILNTEHVPGTILNISYVSTYFILKSVPIR